MRFAVISDTHFGDKFCQLAHYEPPEPKENPVIGKRYEDFKKAAGTRNNFLILLGDIFDFSISSYRDTYRVARVFFQQIQEDGIAEYVIYVPGNHDFDMWHFYEHEVNVIRKITEGKSPRDFRFSIPAIIDGRRKPGSDLLTLYGVDRNPASTWGYGGLFLDKITRNEDGSGSDSNFAIAYPNVYVLTDQGTVMLTHGHYLETYWSLLSEWAPQIAGADLRIGDALDLMEMVAINFPLTQLACTGVGQAGPLTKVVQPLVQEVKGHSFDRVKRYLDKLDDEIDRRTPSRCRLDLAEGLRDLLSHKAKKLILEQLEKTKATRFSEDFFHRKEVLDRFRSFFDATLLEIDQINTEGKIKLDAPRYVICGHDHRPIPWGDNNAPWTRATGRQPITLFNTGGWITQPVHGSDEETFCGAEVFTFDSDRTPPFQSCAIR